MVDRPPALETESSALDSRLNGVFTMANLNFDFLDQDKNGKIKRTEIFQAIPSQDVKGDEAVALATVRQHFKDVRNLDTADGEQRDITKDDLKKLASLGNLKAMKLIAEGKPIFRALDTNGDGQLGKDELEASLKGLKDGPTKNAVQAMLKDFEIIGGKGAKSISAGQVKEYVAKRMTAKEEGSIDAMTTSFNEGKAKLDGANRKTFSEDKSYWSVQGDAPNQGKVGDCWLISAMSSLFEKDPRAVERMIKDNGDGTLTVKFPYKYDGKELETKIAKPSDAELTLYASTGKYGTYGAILEKAVGKLIEEKPELKGILTGIERDRGKGAPVHELLHASKRPGAIELLTGEKATRLNIASLDKEELHHILAASKKDVATCDADSDWPRKASKDIPKPHSLKVGKGTGPGIGAPSESDTPVKPSDTTPLFPDKSDRPERPDKPDKSDAPDRPGPVSPSDIPDRRDDKVPKPKDDLPQPTPKPEEKPKPGPGPGPEPRPHPRPPEDPKPTPKPGPKPWPDIDEDKDEDDDDKDKNAGHEFAILNYDEKRRVVTVRNPWGSGELTDDDGKPLDGKNDGIMELPLDQFIKHFRNASFPQSVIDRGRRAYQESKKK